MIVTPGPDAAVTVRNTPPALGFSGMTFAWLAVYAFRDRQGWRLPAAAENVQRRIEGITGTLLVALGVRLAAERR